MTDTYRGKRAFDLLGAGAACLVFAPLAATIALATVIEDGGPAFFVQRRVGSQRRAFEILKFRSMRDGKVTRVGRWLRRTHLDELPTLNNDGLPEEPKRFIELFAGEIAAATAEDIESSSVLAFEQTLMRFADSIASRYFLQNPDRPLTRDMILNSVWGYESFPNTRTVDAHVVRLRQKLEADPNSPRHFLTVHGVGYRFMP